MKKRPDPQSKPKRPEQRNFTTSNPRHLRVLAALMRRSMRREHIDREAGCSNGPDLVAELRRRGLEIPCVRIDAFDSDGFSCRPGVYHLTSRDRRKLAAWMKARKERGYGA